jgi:hypothetical protein
MQSAVVAPWAIGQAQKRADMAERFWQISEDAEREGLAAPFKGIATSAGIEPDLFTIAPTRVSTEPVRIAAERFIDSLTGIQVAKAIFPVNDIQWRKWMSSCCILRGCITFPRLIAYPPKNALTGKVILAILRSHFGLDEQVLLPYDRQLCFKFTAFFNVRRGHPSEPNAIVRCTGFSNLADSTRLG